MAFLKEKLELKVAEAELEAQKALISFSPAQKWIFIFCLIAIIPAYFAAKEIALHTNLAKYRKTELQAISPAKDPQAVQISDATITQAGDNIYSVVVKITNPNLTLSLDKVNYNFVLYNKANQQIYQNPATLYLLPGESKYLILPRVETTEEIAGVDVKLPDTLPWQKRLNVPEVNLSASTPTFTNQSNPPSFVVQGTFYNNSPYQLNQVDINFVLHDAGGKILAASTRIESTIKPFERRAYVQLWPGVNTNDVVSAEVIPSTDTLDNTNLSTPAVPVTPSSNLSR